jgi:DNA-binding beta-propeller fold protein YncE
MSEANPLVGGGEYTYELQADWAKLPAGWSFKDVAAVAVDSQDRVYVFNRGEHPMIVFDRDGNMLTSWGEGVFHRPHGLHMGPDETIYCTDDGDHTVRKCTLDGKVLLTIGIPGRPSGFMSNQPFNRCTHTALSPDQEIYVSDGYANAAVHKFDPSGRLLHSWGECGCDQGQFNIPHNICCDHDGWVYVADRENHRVQIFDGKGKYESQWNNLHRPCGLYLESGPSGVCYIGELGSFQSVNVNFPNIGPRLTMVARDGKVVGRVDQKSGLPAGQFVAPHGICVDRHGDVYVGEVSFTAWEKYLHPETPIPQGLRSLQKLVRKKL